jgi:tetratricopeptide (TPR) repeat protein
MVRGKEKPMPLNRNPRLSWLSLCRGCYWAMLALAGCATTTPAVNVPERVRDLNELGLTDFSHGKFLEARESFDLALQLTPQDANLLYNLAQCDDRLGRLDNAERYYLQCLQAKPGHLEARYSLGLLFYRTGRKDQLQSLIADWKIEQPASAEPYALDGWRLRQEKDLIGARDRLMEALSKGQKCVHALTELGVLYETMNLPEYALKYYGDSLARNPNQPDVIDRLVQLRLRPNIGAPRPDN